MIFYCRAPGLLVIEDLHLISGSSEGKAVVSSLVGCLDNLQATPPSKHVVVVATTNQIEEIDPSLRRPGRFEREIEITTPSASERRQVSLFLQFWYKTSGKLCFLPYVDTGSVDEGCGTFSNS